MDTGTLHTPAAYAGYLAEQPPFLQLPPHSFTRNGDTLSIQLGRAGDYRLQDFTDLLLVTGTLGALNLALCHAEEAKGYVLMERLRMVRYGTEHNNSALHAAVASTRLSGRKGQGLAHITNNAGQLLYCMTTGYHIFSTADFERLFARHRQAETPGMEQDTVLPAVENRYTADPCTYRMQIGPFTHRHCLGHFPGYPCVPASFAMRCLVSGILEWLKQYAPVSADQLVFDNVEIFAARMIPVATALAGAARVLHTSRRSYKFIITLEQATDATVVYGHYIIDLQSMPLC